MKARELMAKYISIHTPARGVTRYRRLSPESAAISIHTPARGVTNSTGGVYVLADISIHTPARGVTKESADVIQAVKISIHTPARGVTRKPQQDNGQLTNFNPHSRKGSDRTGHNMSVQR